MIAIAIIFIICLAVFVYLLLKGLKAGNNQDNIIERDLMKTRHINPKK